MVKDQKKAQKKGKKKTPEERVRELVEKLPTEPGVYLMKDKKARVLYVGKAASLRARVRSYFRASGDSRAFVALLGRLVGDIETVVTNNEKEALLLENNLIKQHQPRFNIKLIDDKNYLVLRLDEQARYPRLETVRRLGQDGARYFGPYHSATSCRQTLSVVNRHFKLRTCTDHVLHSRQRPCLQFQIKRCDAPCVFPIAAEEYGKQVQDVALFLDGKDDELLLRLRARMKSEAQAMAYEAAGLLRDQIGALEKTLQEQRVVSGDFRDQDVFGLYREGDAIMLVVMHVRGGKLLGRRNFPYSGQEFPSDEILSSFVSLYYDLGANIPDEVLLPLEIEDAKVKADWLSEKRGHSVLVMTPERGPRRKLIDLAAKNASSAFVTRRNKAEDAETALLKLQDRLGLRKLPRRIECFDISHLQGSNTVASMAVFLDGEPAKGEYRRFKVKTATNDDFASMYEVLSRRFRRALQAENEAEDASDEALKGWRAPDLLVIDGGKGQLGSAMAALRDVGHPMIDALGIAKESETVEGEKVTDRVFLPNAKDPIKLRPNSAELYLLGRVRDEAHRFAVEFHRSLRKKRSLRSGLEDIPGIGKKRQRDLLRHFGSLKQLRSVSLEELARAPGMTLALAETVVNFLSTTAGADIFPELDD